MNELMNLSRPQQQVLFCTLLNATTYNVIL